MNVPLKKPAPHTAKSFFSMPLAKEKLNELLGKNAPAFTTSVLQIVNNNSMLVNADPATIFSAACTAATLNLPINNNLGFAYIVPYSTDAKDASGNKIPLLDENGKQVKNFYKNKEFPQWVKTVEAQFQMGYKGFIQLAQRSGQFERIAATAVYDGQLVEANPLLGYKFDWKVKKTGSPIGYVAFFKLINGFTAELYMSIDEINDHAKRYSQSFKSGYGVWKDQFESMALKTVLKLLLSKQAPLSIEMQTAQLADQSVVRNIETADFNYTDNQMMDVTAGETPKIAVPDDEFPTLLEQIKAGAFEKDYVLNEYALTEHQKIAVQNQVVSA